MFSFFKRPVAAASKARDGLGWDEWEHSLDDVDSRFGPVSVYDTIKVKNRSLMVQVSDLAPLDAMAQ